MRSWKLAIDAAVLDGERLDLQHAELLVVLREGDERPGATDWELNVVTADRRRVAPGIHVVRLDADEHHLTGRAVVRFSDGHRHLLRGDDHLDGVAAALDLA